MIFKVTADPEVEAIRQAWFKAAPRVLRAYESAVQRLTVAYAATPLDPLEVARLTRRMERANRQMQAVFGGDLDAIRRAARQK